MSELELKAGGYCLATGHREENTTDTEKLSGIFGAFKRLTAPECPFVVPLHPRTSKALTEVGARDSFGPEVRFLDLISYLDMIQLEANAKVILTDSGGIQKEAYFAQVPCVTLRDETEWVELVEHGFNILGGHEQERICKAFDEMLGRSIPLNPDLCGDAKASEKTVSILCGNHD